jgi:hypothetical protein
MTFSPHILKMGMLFSKPKCFALEGTLYVIVLSVKKHRKYVKVLADDVYNIEDDSGHQGVRFDELVEELTKKISAVLGSQKFDLALKPGEVEQPVLTINCKNIPPKAMQLENSYTLASGYKVHWSKWDRC